MQWEQGNVERFQPGSCKSSRQTERRETAAVSQKGVPPPFHLDGHEQGDKRDRQVLELTCSTLFEGNRDKAGAAIPADLEERALAPVLFGLPDNPGDICRRLDVLTVD